MSAPSASAPDDAWSTLRDRLRALSTAALLRQSMPQIAAMLLDLVVEATGSAGGQLLLPRHSSTAMVTVAGRPVEGPDASDLPVLLDGVPIAVLRLAGPRGALTGLTAALEDIAWALDRARIWDGQLRRNQRLVSLQSLTGRLAAATSTEAVATLALDVAMAQDGTAQARLWQLSEDRAFLLPVPDAHGAAIALGDEGPEAESARTGRVVVVHRPPGTFVAAPVSFDDETFGCLTVAHRSDCLEEVEPAFVAALAEQAAAAMTRLRLHDAERASLARLQLLTEASAALGASLDAEQILDRLLTLLTTRFADSAVLRVLSRQGVWSTRGIRHADPDLQIALQELMASRANSDAVLEQLVVQYARDDEVYINEYPDADVVAQTEDDPARRELVRELDVCCAAVIPLVSPSGLVGALSLTRRRGSGRHLGPGDAQMLRELGTKIGAALRNARVHAEARGVAVTLQRSLLPQRVPELPGLAFAWRYLPGAAGVHIGGDWYDAIALEHGCVGVLIGDVMGRGVQAAAIMGQLRATARAYASAQRPPADVLRQLDIAVGGLEQGYITTALFGVLDPATGVLTVASAGHLPPLCVDARGTASYLTVEPGPPLGAGPANYPQLVTTLEQGSTLMLFTDGLVENRLTPVDVGMERLRVALGGLTDGDPEMACERALVAMAGDRAGRAYDDDTALLAVTLTGRPSGQAGHVWTWRLAERIDAIRAARSALGRTLTDWEVAEELQDDIVLVASELAANALLHVGGDVVLSAEYSPREIRLEVRDTAPDRPPLESLTALTQTAGRRTDSELDPMIRAIDLDNTTGRGMSIVHQLATAWGTDADETGKTVWATFALLGERRRTRRPPLANTEGEVVLRDVPVRLILASAANLDELVREFGTGENGQAVAELGAEGAHLLRRTALTRQPFRIAAREALVRGQRVVDVWAAASPETVTALGRFSDVVDAMVARCQEGRLLALTPSEEVTAFRRWYADEIARQVRGEPPAACPFPPLPRRSGRAGGPGQPDHEGGSLAGS